MVSRYAGGLLVTGGLLLSVACSVSKKQATVEVEPTIKHEPLDKDETRLTESLAADRIGLWVYEVEPDTKKKDRPARTYVRRSTSARITEGNLVYRGVLPLHEYVIEEGDGPDPEPAVLISAERLKRQRKTLIYTDLVEPLPAVPVDLKVGEQREARTSLVYYNYEGKRQAEGELTRVTTFEGIEDVETPAGRFERCCRLNVALEVRFPWVSVITLESRRWLSPEVGEVKRTNKMSGWVLIFWFGSEQTYNLRAHRRLTEAAPPQEPDRLAPHWEMLLVELSGGYPHPWISGMVVELAQDETTDGGESLPLGQAMER